MQTSDAELGVAALTETVTVQADVAVLDISSARIGVNVSPEEVENLPVNGRNFANLMTLATGATSDGNGGWASIRFNGKSNQQNYLNYDGVDGTYVWDASPATSTPRARSSACRRRWSRSRSSASTPASRRRKAASAPAATSPSSARAATTASAARSSSTSATMRSTAASKYDDVKQELSLDQFGGSIGGPLAKNRTFFFASYEGLRQTTGLKFTEAVPSDEARRRILAGEPVGSGGGQSARAHPRRRAAPNGFPLGTTPTSNALAALTSLQIDRRAAGGHASPSGSITSSRNNHSAYVRYLYSEGEVDTPDRTVTPRRVRAKQIAARTSWATTRASSACW